MISLFREFNHPNENNKKGENHYWQHDWVRSIEWVLADIVS
jgi:hypothetical protein